MTYTVKGIAQPQEGDDAKATDPGDAARAGFEHVTAGGRAIPVEGLDVHVRAEEILAEKGLVGPGGIAGASARRYTAEEYTAACAQAEAEAAA